MPTLIERLLGDGHSDEAADPERREGEANEVLRSAVDQEDYEIDDCGVTGVAVVNEGPNGEPVTAPIARFSLGEAVEEPDMDLVAQLVGEAADALYDPFADVFCRHYDVQFVFDGDELFEAEECRRVALTGELVERYATENGFGAVELRGAVEAADDIDDAIAPVAWGECRDYSRTENGAVVPSTMAAGAATSGGAVAAASCAGAGAAAAAGGSCGV